MLVRVYVLLPKQAVVLDRTNNRIRTCPGASTASIDLENDCRARSEVRMWYEGGSLEAEDE